MARTLAPAADHGRLAVNGIVEIARIFTINRDQRNVGQIDAARPVLRLHRDRQRLGGLQAGIGKHMRHAILAYGNLDFHAGIIDFTEHLDDAAYRLAIQRRCFGQLDHHHLTGIGLGDGILGNDHVLTVAPVFRGHQPDTVFL